MRCSSCKQLLDRYAEGTISAQQMLQVSQHIETCSECSSVFEELKVVDALLSTLTTKAAPAPNFTFAVMAEVRSMPAPAVPRTNALAITAAYVAVAWGIIAVWLKLAGVGFAGGLAMAGSAAASAASTIHAITAGASGIFGSGTPAIVAVVLGVLLLDAALALGIAYVYFVIRPRLAARIASLPEVQ